MSWAHTDPMKERLKFVLAVGKTKASFSALCRTFDVTTKTGYKWLNRYREFGEAGLFDASRRPQSNSRAMSRAVAQRLIRLREERPTWGPRKLLAWLEVHEPKLELPAASSVGELLKRSGLVSRRPEKRRPKSAPRSAPLRHATSPNRVWSMDFKGWFLVGDGTRCDPLTITDNYSRFLLCCQSFEGQWSIDVWVALRHTFTEFGLPEAIRVDNQQPWVSPKGELGLTVLSVKLMRLGIALEQIDTGKPQQNGRHERFHLTLKSETAVPPASTLESQQARFDEFRSIYNEDRPHEALGMRTPNSVYRASERRLPPRLPEPQYPPWFQTQVVPSSGRIKSRNNNDFFLSTALQGERIGLFEIDEDCFEVRFCDLLLGRFHQRYPELGIIPLYKPLPMSPV